MTVENVTDRYPRRVVVTGLGIVSAAGIGKDACWEVLSNGRSCVDYITKFDTTHTNVKIAAELKKTKAPRYPKPKTPIDLDRVSRFALLASHLALEDSGLDLQSEKMDRIGTVLGTSVGGLEGGGHSYYQFVQALEHGSNLDDSPNLSHRLSFFPGSMARNINLTYGFSGRSDVVSTGCVSSADAIGTAFEHIQYGDADIMLAGGAEDPINLYTIKAFDVVMALSTKSDDPQKASRPFDRKRNGFVMGEGGAILILEELEHAKERGARIYNEIGAFHSTCDAYHQTASSPSQEIAAVAVRQAIRDAKIDRNDVAYISAHGTSTPKNDIQETILIKKVFGDQAYKIPVSSIKSMMGHTSGAAGSMQAVSCCLAFENNMIPPTINYEFPDRECDLDYVPNEARSWNGSVILQNTFGFAGKNAALIYKRYQ